MAINLGILEMLLQLRDEVTPGLRVVQHSLDQSGQAMTKAGMATLPLSAAIAAVGVGSLKMATDLNASLANVSALLTNLSGSELNTVVTSMKGQVQALAVSMGKSTTDIAGGLYEVISALGFTDDTFGQLEIAAKAGAAGLATTQEAFNFLSSVTKTYGDTSEAAFKKAADLGFQAVNFGQTTFPELAASIGGVAPIAKVAGVSLEELFAVIATATGVTGSTSEVVTQMASSLNALLSPSSDMEKAFTAIGVASGEALIQQRGFVGALQAVSEFAEKTKTPLLDLLGRKEAFILTASLAGSQAQKFGELLGEMGVAAGASGAVVEAAFAKQTKGVNAAGFAWQQFKAEMQVTAQRLGDTLLPIVLRAAEAMRPLWEHVKMAVEWFGRLPQPVQTLVAGLGALMAALSPVLLVLGSLATGLSSLIGLAGLAGASAALTTTTQAVTSAGVAFKASGVLVGGFTVGLAGIVVPFALIQIVKIVEQLKGLLADQAAWKADDIAEAATHMRAMAEASRIAGNEITSLADAKKILQAEAGRLRDINLRGVDAMQGATIVVEGFKATVQAAAPAVDALGKAQGAATALTDEQKEALKKATDAHTAWLAEVRKLDDVRLLNAEIDSALGGYAGLAQRADDARLAQGRLDAEVESAITVMQNYAVENEHFNALLRDRALLESEVESALGDRYQREASALDRQHLDTALLQSEIDSAVVQSVGLWDRLKGSIKSLFTDGSTAMSTLTQGVGLFSRTAASALQSAFQVGTGAARLFAGDFSQLIPTIMAGINLVKNGLGAIWSGIKSIFGGVSAMEQQGRSAAAAFRAELKATLTDTQLLEVGTDEWKTSIIAIRDAYLAAGRTEEEALAISRQLWEAEKQGPEAVKRVIQEIQGVMQQGLIPATQAAGRAMADAARLARGSFADVTGAIDILQAKLRNTESLQVLSAELAKASKGGVFDLQAILREVEAITASLGTSDPAVQVLQDAIARAAVTGVIDFQAMGAAIAALKAQMAVPIVVPVKFDIEDFLANVPGAERRRAGSGRDDAFLRFTGANLKEAAADFLRRNPGDTHRIASALEVSQAEVTAAGFQGGTHGRFVDFGAGTPALLHGRERVQTEAEGRAEAGRAAAVEGRLASIERLLTRVMRDQPRAIGLAIQDALVLGGVR